MLSNATILRGQITVSHGANVAAQATNTVNAAFNGAAVGDGVITVPVAAPATSITVNQAPRVTTAGSVSVQIANIGTATVAAGTAVVYDVYVLKAFGQASQ